MSAKTESLDGFNAADLIEKYSLASIAISLKRIADTLASVDTRRMVETGTGSMRSTSSAVPNGETPPICDDPMWYCGGDTSR